MSGSDRSLLDRLDPSRHLAAAIGWSVFLVVTAFAIASADLAAREARSRARVDTQRVLTQIATQIGRSLGLNLSTRQSALQALAARISAAGDDDLELQRRLQGVQRALPGFEWLAVAGPQGRIRASTGTTPAAGTDVLQQPWFKASIDATADDPDSPGFLEMSVPLSGSGSESPDAKTHGVLGARLSSAWLERLAADLLSSLDGQRQLQLLAATADGTVLIGPARWLGGSLAGIGDLSEGGAFLVGRSLDDSTRADATGWSIVLRQVADDALAPARTTQKTVFLSVLGAGVLSAAIAVLITSFLTRRLERLAAQAQALQEGGAQSLVVPGGRDEVSRIGAILADVVTRLQQEKRALLQLNDDLDRRVAERTEHIGRLGEDARHAAVTRERLRLARDLHDTLAHSLMALLMQIRLVRKLRTRWSDAQIGEELDRAEAVAASGLAEARAAINQMRHNGVREAGLGPALAELLKRLRSRCDLAATLQIDAEVAGLAGERAETAFRIVEEALHNVERHARAGRVELLLTCLEASPAGGAEHEYGPRFSVRLEVRDDGIGFDPSCRVPGHHGLRGMHEQAALLGARLEIDSRVGEGTCVNLEFVA